ncbi:10265_t:CDS:2, partial [Gigaspora margarita]
MDMKSIYYQVVETMDMDVDQGQQLSKLQKILTSSAKQKNLDHQDLQSSDSSSIRFLPNNTYVEKKSTDDYYAENVLIYNQNVKYLTTKYSLAKGTDTSTPILPMTSSHTNALDDDCFIKVEDAFFLNSHIVWNYDSSTKSQNSKIEHNWIDIVKE